MKINVLHIVDKYGFGGVETIVDYLIHNFINDDEINLSYLFLRDTEVRVVEKKSNVVVKNRNKYSPLSFLDIINQIKKNNIRIVHTHHRKGFYLCALLVFFMDIRLIHHEHGDILVKNYFYKFVHRLIKNKIHKIVCVSPYVGKIIRDEICVNEARIAILNNFVELNQKKCSTSLLREGEIHIGFVGRLSPVKGCEYLLRSLPYIDKDVKYYLHIAGNGPSLDSLIKLSKELGVEKKVTFMGYLDIVTGIYDIVDIIVVPSLSEAVSIAVLEAWSLCKPVVVTELKSLEFFTKDSVNVLKFHSGDSKHLASKICLLYRDKPLRETLVLNARKDVEQFGADIFLSKLRKIYDINQK